MRWWIKAVFVLVLAGVLALGALSLGNNILAVLRGADIGTGEKDPMFAEEAELITRPPEIYPEETQKPHKTLDDHVMKNESPVDKTAQELILEAQAGGE